MAGFVFAWPLGRRSRAHGDAVPGKPRRGNGGSTVRTGRHRETWLEDAEATLKLAVSSPASVGSFLQLQNLLKRLNAADEAEVQLWCQQLPGRELTDFEAQLRQRAMEIFESVKFELAKVKPSSSQALRADLFRPSFGSLGGTEIATACETKGAGAECLAELSGCSAEDAARLIRFGRRLSELFAPIELTKQMARQDWSKVPYASAAALLPSLDVLIRSLQAGGIKVNVSVLGSLGCLLAAAAHRLGCPTTLAEPRPMLRRCVQRLLEHNGCGGCVVAEEADAEAEIFVLAHDDDGLVEWGQLQMLKSHLQKRKQLGMMKPPRLVPERIRIKAALIDDTLPRIRGCQLNRFERMRGLDLQISHRWPKGACHIPPQFRSSPQVIYDLDIFEFVGGAVDRAHVSFQPEPGMLVSGIAYWLTFPGNQGVFPSKTATTGPEDAWICCMQPLPVRRVTDCNSVHLWVNFSDSKLWFEWDGGDAPVVPALGKTKLPPWHFKMLNDHQRNRQYHLAIARALARARLRAAPIRMLDCGCGAGLLSLLAAREAGATGGALEITAVELSPLIADLAQPILRDGADAGTQLMTCDVRGLRAEEVGRYDIIVSELMDASGVGESLLSVLQHACHHLARPGAQVIPMGLRLVGALGWLSLPNCHDAFDFGALDALHFCSRRGGPFSKAAETVPAKLRAGYDLPSLHSGPFTSRNLNRLRRSEVWDLLTAEQTLLTVDFQAALDTGTSSYPYAAEVELRATADGVANCLIWWWEVQLDEKETLSNRPVALGGSYVTHWHQPLLPVGPLPVAAGDRFLLEVSIADAAGQKLSFNLKPAAPGSASAWGSETPRLEADPLLPLLETWHRELEEACAENTALTSKFTSRGDLEGLAKLQKAVLALCLMPRAFGCDPWIRDRLLQSYFGVAYK